MTYKRRYNKSSNPEINIKLKAEETAIKDDTISKRSASKAGTKKRRRNIRGCIEEQKKKEVHNMETAPKLTISDDFLTLLVNPGTPFIKRKQLIMQ